MKKVSIIGLDIEDYYGTAVENIDFESTLEIEPECFNVRVSGFCFAGLEKEGEDFIIRIQCSHEDSLSVKEDINEIQSQIMEILLEGSEGFLENEKEIMNRIYNSLELLC